MAHLVEQGDFPRVERDGVLMGTDVNFLIATEKKAKAETAIDAAMAEIKRIEDLMTDWRESPLEEINKHAGISPMKTDPEILFVLRQAEKISEITDGGFDVTYAGVGKLWGNFVEPPFRVPPAEEIQKALPLVGYKKLHLDLKNQTAFLEKKGMRIGLGGIAKGYAVDRAAMVLEKHGFKNFALKAGGDMVVRGRKGKELWWVAIRDPRDKTKNVALLPVSNASISTSGDYERFFEINGKRYAHIINPKTGYPVENCRSVTLINKDSFYTDGLTKGVFVMGPQKGMELIERLKDVEGMIIDGEGHVSLSSGLQKKQRRQGS